jgi:ketosteroid isomerase-like protein
MGTKAFALSTLALSCGCAGAGRPVAAPPSSPGATACSVWEREVGFARSVQEHEANAFAEHVHPGATFIDGDSLLRGPAAIAEAWKVFLVGEKLRIDWHPRTVVLSGGGRVALSRGPYWIERMKPDANPRFLTGVYQSVWVQDADGVWRVTIDGGTPEPVPANEADVAKIKASLPAQCPTEG